MPVPKSRSRRLRIDEQTYLWLASMHWDFDVAPDGKKWKKEPRFVDLHVSRDEDSIGVIRARFPVEQLDAWGWRVREHRRALPDPLVERAIRYAKTQGWQPGETDFNLPMERVRFLQTFRHLLYTEPIIARVRVLERHTERPGLTTIQASIIHLIRGRPGSEFRFTAALPAEQIPEQALVFLHADASGSLTTWSRYAGVFRISGNDVLIYDNSGLENRWGFRPLPKILEEITAMGGEE